MSGHHRPHQGRSDSWQTPPEILAALGPFDDDPAQAGRRDGLTRAWHGLVWCNPPYGPAVGRWLARCADHGDALALVFARTETRWFFETVWARASALLFVRGRLHFYRRGRRAQSNSGAPSVVIAYGPTAVSRLRRSGLSGAFVEGWRA